MSDGFTLGEIELLLLAIAIMLTVLYWFYLTTRKDA